jgi:hypothetical protein
LVLHLLRIGFVLAACLLSRVISLIYVDFGFSGPLDTHHPAFAEQASLRLLLLRCIKNPCIVKAL